jgi:predicted RNA-binding Zn ribbon-like protein
MIEPVKSISPSADDLAFRFVSGHAALDFAATFGDRHRAGIERLREPRDLDRWLRSAGLPAPAQATAADLEEGRVLREAIYRLAHAALGDSAPISADVATLNAWARAPRLSPQLDDRLQRGWTAAEPVRGALALLACEAVELLSGPERQLIRECAAAPACSLLYLDRSRGRRRRWCQMERCGSRAKMAEYRKRQYAAEPAHGNG